jgi:hypothetical protein
MRLVTLLAVLATLGDAAPRASHAQGATTSLFLPIAVVATPRLFVTPYSSTLSCNSKLPCNRNYQYFVNAILYADDDYREVRYRISLYQQGRKINEALVSPVHRSLKHGVHDRLTATFWLGDTTITDLARYSSTVELESFIQGGDPGYVQLAVQRSCEMTLPLGPVTMVTTFTNGSLMTVQGIVLTERAEFVYAETLDVRLAPGAIYTETSNPFYGRRCDSQQVFAFGSSVQ